MSVRDCGCKTDGRTVFHTGECRERRRLGLRPPTSDLETYHLPNRRPYPRLFRWLLRWLQRRCQHRALKADILEGSAYPHGVRWCETCGSVWLTIGGTPCGGWPRYPEPLWEV